MSLLCVPHSANLKRKQKGAGREAGLGQATLCSSPAVLICAHLLLLWLFLTSVRRTQVIDDESDYFATDSNQWLSKQEREALQKREQELRELRHASQLAKKITIDFAGRQILEEDNSMAEYHSK